MKEIRTKLYYIHFLLLKFRFYYSELKRGRMQLAAVDAENGRLRGYLKALTSLKELKMLANPVRVKILKALASKPMSISEVAEELSISEQLAHYHLSKLRECGLVRGIESFRVRGTLATRYTLSVDGFAILFREASEEKPCRVPSPIFELLFEKDKEVYLVLSSPEPHGPFRSRGRDHYLAAHLAYALGSFYGGRIDFQVILDTEFMRKRRVEANLIIFGGPVVNMVAAAINESLPIRFNIEKNNAIVSNASGKTYYEDDCGIVEFSPTPLGKVILIAGRHLTGTKAAVIAVFKNPVELAKPNTYDENTIAHVIQGMDGDGDGEIDDVVILE